MLGRWRSLLKLAILLCVMNLLWSWSRLTYKLRSGVVQVEADTTSDEHVTAPEFDQVEEASSMNRLPGGEISLTNIDTSPVRVAELDDMNVLEPLPLYQKQDAPYVHWLYTEDRSLESKLLFFNNFLTELRRNLSTEPLSGVVYGEWLPCPPELLDRNFTIIRGLNKSQHNFEFGSRGASTTYFMSWQDSRNAAQSMSDIVAQLPIQKFYHCVKGPELVRRYGNYSSLQTFLYRELCLYDCSSDWKDLITPRAPPETLFYSYVHHTKTTGCPKILKNQHGVHLDVLHSMDVIHNAMVERQGNVIKDNHWMSLFSFGVGRIGDQMPFTCLENNHSYMHVRSLFVSTQNPVSRHKSLNFAHILSEMLTKIAPYLKFLQDNPDIMVHIPVAKSFIPHVYSIYGLRNKFIDGAVLADTIFLPHPSGITNIFLPTAHAAHLFFESKIASSFGTEAAALWDSVLLIKRSSRQLNHFDLLADHLRSLCVTFGYRFYIFDDAQLPKFEDSMLEFHRARFVIGPHGAGLANTIFMKPGSAVLEVMCTPYWPRTTFSNIALKKGLRYYVTVTILEKNQRRCNTEGLTVNIEEFRNITNYVFEHVLQHGRPDREYRRV